MNKMQNIIEALKVQPLSEEEKEKRHILKRLSGPIASCNESTRNGRKYNKELWERALGDDLFAEKIKTKSLMLELGHPEDREETDMTKVCACIPEAPKIIDGDLYAVVDVLDTPNGRLLNTLIDYGFVPGISSRGSGDVVGDEVDPNSFFLETWDIVQIPALEKARLVVTESLNNRQTLTQALTESLNNANVEDRRIMEQALKDLNIDLKENSEETREDKKVQEDVKLNESKEVSDAESSKLVKSLREALRSRAELETKLQKLQEEKAVSDTKVSKLEEELRRYKQTSIHLSKVVTSNKGLKKENQSLQEELKKRDDIISEKDEKIKSQMTTISQKNLRIKQVMENLNKVSEANNNKQELNESLDTQKKSYEKQINSLQEKLETLKSDSQTQIKEYASRLDKNSKLVEKYKSYLTESVNRYIEAKAELYGVKSVEIKNRLNESYTLDDIDSICEDLQKYNLRMNKLPFNLNNKDTKVRVIESKQTRYEQVKPEDDISSLIELSGIKI